MRTWGGDDRPKETGREQLLVCMAAVIRQVGQQAERVPVAARRLRVGVRLLRDGVFDPAPCRQVEEPELEARQIAWSERQHAASAYHGLVIGRQQSDADEQPGFSRPERNAGPDTLNPSGDRVVFLNVPDAEGGSVQGHKLKRDYALACRFLHCAIMDRTGTLDQGFPYVTLDPIPRISRKLVCFGTLCDTIGAEIVAEAVRADKPIAVLWSGGIDSTTALIAIIKAATARGCLDRVCVLLSLDSVSEYPGFFLRHISTSLQVQPVSRPMSAFLNPAVLNVTGEHGDQLFGSQLLKPYVQGGFGQLPYRDVLPAILLQRLGNPIGARRVWRYLEPVIQAAPVPIVTVFDYMWWLNYALKWQNVTLRLAVTRGDDTWAVYRSLRHFFRDSRFQEWALSHTPGYPTVTWSQYKDVAKHYILDFTGDRNYFLNKEKEDSLRNVMIEDESLAQHLIFVREDFRPLSTLQSFHTATWSTSSPGFSPARRPIWTMLKGQTPNGLKDDPGS